MNADLTATPLARLHHGQNHAGYPKGFRASLFILVLQLPDRAFVRKLVPDCTVSFGAI
jgi:hypothetical protein